MTEVIRLAERDGVVMPVKGHLHLYPFDRSRACNRGVQGSFRFLSRTTTRRGRSCLPFPIELS